MSTREEAIENAARSIAHAYLSLWEGSAREAAERAYTPGGPSVDELEARIVAYREAA